MVTQAAQVKLSESQNQTKRHKFRKGRRGLDRDLGEKREGETRGTQIHHTHV